MVAFLRVMAYNILIIDHARARHAVKGADENDEKYFDRYGGGSAA